MKILELFCYLRLLLFFLVGCTHEEGAELTFDEALKNAQEERTYEIMESLSNSIGTWSVTELSLPMTIGQDSTREQLGIELSQADLEIFKDYSVQLGQEIYMINDIAIKDYEWYLDKFRQGPYFAEGLIVELEYVNAEEDKKFSICIAENEMYLFSYAYGFYSVVRKDKESNVSIGEIEESVFDRLSNAYIKRYGDIESQLDSMCGVWEGKKYSFTDDLAKLEGTYGMEMKWENEAKLVIDFEGKELETKLLEVFSTGSYTEEAYCELLNVPSQVRPYLRQYSEGYILHLKQDEKDIYIALSKVDLEQKKIEKKMEIFIEEELYSFQQ